jgi:hypothetical protein
MTSTGAAPVVQSGGGTQTSTFTGLVTKNYNGAYTLTVVGLTTIVLAAVTLTVGIVTLAVPLALTGIVSVGVAGAKFRLANERLFILLQDILHVQANHVHAVAAAPGISGMSDLTTATQITGALPPRTGPLTNVPAGNVLGDVLLMTAQNLTAN